MKKFLVAFGLLWTSLHALGQTCEIPASQVNVAGVALEQPFSEFQRQHPTAILRSSGSKNLSVQFKVQGGSNTDAALQRQGVNSAMHIAITPGTRNIQSFALNFTDSRFATFDTPLERFHSRILQQFSVPQKGWQKHGHHMVYRCDDYLIDISQDHGNGRQALGATVMVIGKHSEMFHDKDLYE